MSGGIDDGYSEGISHTFESGFKSLMREYNLKAYKLKFVTYLESIGISKEHAEKEVEAHIENVGIDDLGDPIQDADECLSYYGD